MQFFLHNPQADAVYVQFTPQRIASSVELDEQRVVDYDQTGTPVGVEFHFVSEGIDLTGLPEDAQMAAALTDAGLTLTATAV